MSGIGLSDIDPQIAGVVATLLMALSVSAQARVRRLRSDLGNLLNDGVDPQTGLLPGGAIPIRLEPELQWARHEHKRVGLVVFRVLGGGAGKAAGALRRAARG